MLGDNIAYAVGRFGGRRLIVRYGARIGITGGRLAKVETFFRRYGGQVVLAARFFAVLRQLNGIVAGSVGMSWWRFVAYNAVGAALWVGAWGFGAYYFGQTLGHVIARFHGLSYVIGLLALILIVGCVALYWRREQTRS